MKLGNDHTAPSPGSSAWLMVEWIEPDGSYSRQTVKWDGYTAEDLERHWRKRAKDAKWDYTTGPGWIRQLSDIHGIGYRTFHDTDPREWLMPTWAKEAKHGKR